VSSRTGNEANAGLRPNYSGRWQFDATASALQIEAPDAVTFVVDHHEPVFRLERSLTFGDKTDTFAIVLTVDAENPPFSRGDATLYASLRWDGDELEFLTRIVRGNAEATNSVRYRLEEEGALLVAAESFRSRDLDYDNRWVLRKA